MSAFNWVREHKVQSSLMLVAIANVFYLIWCAVEGTPTSPIGTLLTPIIILSAVILGLRESRESR
jgi:uncharacterized membrane protein